MSEGIKKVISYKLEASWGAKPAATGPNAQALRRVTGTWQLEKDAYESGEINTSQQVKDFRHGSRRSSGSLSGELSGSAYSDFIAAGLRRDFTNGVTTGALIVIAADETTGTSTFVRSTGSFVTDGFKDGDIINVTGFTDSSNNGLFVIANVTATTLTVEHFDEGGVLVTEAEGDSVTIAVKGAVTYTPTSGHTDDTFTVEEWNEDSEISRIFLGQIVDTMAFNIAPNSMATVDFGFMGKNAEAPTGTQYFTSPVAQANEGIYSGPDGLLLINGVASRKVTSLTLNVANGTTMEPVIGSVIQGAKSRGKVTVTGSLSAIFDDDTIFGYFDNETEVSITYALRSADGTEAFGFHMPRVKVNSGTTDDGEKVIILSADYQALEYLGTADGVLATTLRVQDTSLVVS
jgi:hypothetical protein